MIQNIDSIIANAHWNNNLFMYKYRLLYSLAFIFFWRKRKISEYIHIFKKIEHNYKIYTDDIMLKPIMENGNVRTFKRFDIIEISNENDHDKKVIIDNLKLLENSKEDIVA